MSSPPPPQPSTEEGAGTPILPELAGFERAARSTSPILLVGESGTGRSALARRAHALSARAHGPLIEVDLAALPATLIESELFGHRRGAFTGSAGNPGRVAHAESGSLLLDHVEEIPLAAQPKLLRLLAEGVYAPLGGKEETADVRFLAIAAEDLASRVEAGLVRRDLFHRLEVLVFRLPPLRERREEIPRIAEALLEDLRRRFGRPELRFDAEALTRLAARAWPGNLRELRNEIERAALTARPEDGEVRPASDGIGSGANAPDPAFALELVEAETIRRALAATRGHQGEAARLLGISRKSLWERRRRHGIP